MKASSILLGMCLLAPVSFAKDFGWFSARFGAEMQGLLVSDSWHTKATTTTRHLDALTSAVTNSSGYSYQESGSKLSNFVIGGRFTTRADFFEDNLSVMLALGIESGMKDANGYRPLDPTSNVGGITIAEWDAQATTAVAKWTNKTTIVPVLFMGMGPLSLGVGYDNRAFTISGHDPALTTYLDGVIADKQVIYGFRAEQSYEEWDRNWIVSFEFMTNLGNASDKETVDYFRNLAKYGTDVWLDAFPSILLTSGVFDGAGNVSSPENRAKVASVNTNLTKISVGVGVEFSGG